MVLAVSFGTHWFIGFAAVFRSRARVCPRPWSFLSCAVHTPAVSRGAVALLRDVLSFRVTLRDISADNWIPLWTSGLHTVSMVLAVSFGALGLNWF